MNDRFSWKPVFNKKTTHLISQSSAIVQNVQHTDKTADSLVSTSKKKVARKNIPLLYR